MEQLKEMTTTIGKNLGHVEERMLPGGQKRRKKPIYPFVQGTSDGSASMKELVRPRSTVQCFES